MSSSVGLTVLNGAILYSTFVMPIFTATFSAIFANPIFLIPSLTFNYLIYKRSYIYFYGDRAEVVNMFLKQNGKQVIIETLDGESKIINNTDIYGAKFIENRHE
jgi:hypothetical protein